MGWSTNEKAVAKRQRQQEKKNKHQDQKNQKKQAKKWKDQVTDKKLDDQRSKQQKRLNQLKKKEELKDMLKKQEQQMQKISKKKQEFQTKKLTQAQIALQQQRRLLGSLDDSSSGSQGQQNPNRQQNQFKVAKNVEQALNLLDLKEDSHPQKRFRAVFDAYCEKRQPILKIQSPGMKRSQRMQQLRKQFDKHPENPFNKAKQ